MLNSGCREATMPHEWPIYAPDISHSHLYYPHPGVRPSLRYNHDIDIVRYRGRYFGAWNANEVQAEDVPGQFNFLAVSDDFENWTGAVRLFCADGGCTNPVETDNQWQPSFINRRDEVLYCNWCDYNSRRTFIATSEDGLVWTNHEVPTAPAELEGQVVGFPTNHGLITAAGTMLFPNSLPFAAPKCIVGDTRYAGLLRSEDGGRNWSWSAPIEAISWSAMGENPDDHGGETVCLWEPMVFEESPGRLGLLVRNSTSQDAPERLDKPHQMLLYGTSTDEGKTWTKLRPVELDTIISRNFAVSGPEVGDGLLMVHNDWWVNIPERISRDRYCLSLFVAPVPDPDLLLPGPVVQPDGACAFYPNGFVDEGKLRLAYTYPPGIETSTIATLPDFSRPFLLPRGGRPGLILDGDVARLTQRQSTLGLVLTPELTGQPVLKIVFDIGLWRYDGKPYPLLTLGGKTRDGAVLRAVYDEVEGDDVLELLDTSGQRTVVGPLPYQQFNRVEVTIETARLVVSTGGGHGELPVGVLRKVAFGGLYLQPAWPMGRSWASDVRVRLDTLRVD